MTVAPQQIVLLAAGMGTRLGDLNGGLPKALFEVAGHKLIDLALAFAGRFPGAERIVVGGFQFDRLATHLAAGEERITLLENARFLAGNLLTLEVALPALRGATLLMNIDHVYPAAVAERIHAQAGEHVTAFVDFDRELGADDMKVQLDEARRVRAISKRLDTWDCGYVGMTYVPGPELSRYVAAAAAVKATIGEAAHVEQVLQRLADDGAPVEIGDISGIGWHELDTPEDVARALPSLTNLAPQLR